MTIRVALNHLTRYRFDRPVKLWPHEIRLRPAPHARTPVLSYSLNIEPAGKGAPFINWQQDPFGNWIARLVFPEPATELAITVDLVANMTVINPFDFFIEEYAEKFPFAYADGLKRELAPYLDCDAGGPLLAAWMQTLRAEVLPQHERIIDLLVGVNQRVQRDIAYIVRMEPGVQTPDETLEKRLGSCRDSAWLLVQVLRRLGLAARFASGYLIQLKADQEALDGPSGTTHDFTDLHAWTEVYIPGAGWIGLDPTSGLCAGEGHIPLACTALPSSAAPVTGATEKCEVAFDFAMSVTRIHEDPRVTKPYTPQQWQAIVDLGHQVDAELKAQDVRLTMGGEPTFVAIDNMDGAEWNFTALSEEKRALAEKLFLRMQQRLAPGALLHFGQGKWYPGEPLPRWALGCYWRRDGVPLWRDPVLIAIDAPAQATTPAEALRFGCLLARQLGLSEKFLIPAYEDPITHLDAEQRWPANFDPLAHDLKDPDERKRIAGHLERGLGEPVGYVLPVKPLARLAAVPVKPTKAKAEAAEAAAPKAATKVTPKTASPAKPQRRPLDGALADFAQSATGAGAEQCSAKPQRRPASADLGASPASPPAHFRSSPWPLRRERLYLLAGDSPLGLRLPLASLPWVAPDEVETEHGRDPFDVPGDLPTVRLPEDIAEPKDGDYDATEIVHTALCVEVRAGVLHVFLPPVSLLEDFVALLHAIEASAAALKLPLRIEGYTPPADARLADFKVTPDPGVIEVNVAPATHWAELVAHTEALYEDARQTRLGTEKFQLDGRHTGTGGGNHVTIGGATPGDSPCLRRPDLLMSLIAYWQNHPALSYLFSGMFIGPTSQAPRVDEARHESLYELEIAFQQLRLHGGMPGSGKEAAPWLVDRLLRHLLVDLSGNTHRAEFCIDKLYSPDGPAGRLGLVEFRGFEMPPHAQMSLLQMLLLRALVARFWRTPYAGDLVRWGTRLHDQFMLPHFVAADLADVVRDLQRSGYAVDFEWFAPFLEFRFPRYGTVSYHGIAIELRQAIQPWHVLGEEVGASGTARYVDSSVERLQVKLTGLNDARHVLCCNGRPVPLTATGVRGEFVAGVRYRAWNPPSALHPTIGVHTPLVFDLVDTWSGRAIGGCTYHVAHPGGRNYNSFPVNANEAEARRGARFIAHGHTPGPMHVRREGRNPDYPLTLDLRRAPEQWFGDSVGTPAAQAQQ